MSLDLTVLELISKRSSLLYYLLRNSPVTRADLRQVIGVSQPTVTQWLKDLLAVGLVREIGINPNGAALGRPRVLVEINPEAAWVGALHITSRTAEVGLVNFAGEVIESANMSWESLEMSYSTSLLEILTSKLTQWVKARGIPPARMLGLGVATSGPVDDRSGEVASYDLIHGVLQRQGFPIRDQLTAYTNWPMSMDTNAWAIALGERWFGSGYDNFMLLHVNEGIAAGTVINGQLHKGAGLAGELLTVKVALQNTASALCNRSMRISEIVDRKRILGRIPAERGFTELTQVVTAAIAGDKEVLGVLLECAEAIATICSPIMNVLDLDAVVLSGPMFEVPDVISYIRQHIQDQSFAGTLDNRPPQVIPTSFPRHAGLVGAASLVFDHVFYGTSLGQDNWPLSKC